MENREWRKEEREEERRKREELGNLFISLLLTFKSTYSHLKYVVKKQKKGKKEETTDAKRKKPWGGGGWVIHQKLTKIKFHCQTGKKARIGAPNVCHHPYEAKNEEKKAKHRERKERGVSLTSFFYFSFIIFFKVFGF